MDTRQFYKPKKDQKWLGNAGSSKWKKYSDHSISRSWHAEYQIRIFRGMRRRDKVGDLEKGQSLFEGCTGGWLNKSFNSN